MGAKVLILGRFGKGVFEQIYPARLVARDWRRIAQVDYYDIYVRQARAPSLITKPGKTQPIKATTATAPNLQVTSH